MNNILLKGVTSNTNKRRGFLLIIGVSNYLDSKSSGSKENGWGKLNNAKKDAVTICSLLQNNYGFREECTYEIYNEKVTRKNIFSTFNKLQQVISKDDDLLIYYSGHGYLSMDYEGNPTDGAWIPFDAEFDTSDQHFTNSDLKKELDKIKAKHILVIADACHSGALISGKIKGANSISNIKLYATPSRQAFCSGRMKDKVSDGPKNGHSPFAQAIISVLENAEEYCFLEFVTKVRAEVNQICEKLKMNIEPTHGQLEIPGYDNDYQGEFVFYPQKKLFSKEYQQWKVAINSKSIKEYKEYLLLHPNGRYKNEAQNFIIIQQQKQKTRKILLFFLMLGAFVAIYFCYNKAQEYIYSNHLKSVKQILNEANPVIDKAIQSLEEAIKTGVRGSDTLSIQIDDLNLYITLTAKGDSCLNKESINQIQLGDAILYYEKALAITYRRGINPTVVNEKLLYSRLEINKYLKTSFIDVRDGQLYPTVRLGTQEWLAKNLNYNSSEGSYCYDNTPNNCKNFGRLYTWEAAKNACPSGWKLPTNEDWIQLAELAGGYYSIVDGTHTGDPKKAYYILTDTTGFAAISGGYRGVDGGFEYLNRRGRYWSLDEHNKEEAYFYFTSKDGDSFGENVGDKLNSRSCRCIKIMTSDN